MKNSYENDGNIYCHGIVNCKYYHGECCFMDMGSGDLDDMPCRVQESEDLEAFREWRKKQEKEQKSDLISREALRNEIDTWGCNDYDKYDFLEAIDNAPTVEPERPTGEWNYIQAGMCVCPFCGAMPHKLYKDYCAKCGAYLKGGDK